MEVGMLPYIYPFGVVISMYTLMAILSIVAFFLCLVEQREIVKFSRKKAIFTGCIVLVAVVLSSIFFYTILHLKELGTEEFQTTYFSYFGGILFVPLFLPLYAKILNIRVDSLFDYIAPPVLLWDAVFRVGCLCAGCCGGKSFYAMGYEFVLPTQMMEIVLALGIMVYLMNLKAKKVGELYPRFLIYYGIGRFIIEGLREEVIDLTSVEFWVVDSGYLTWYQVISVVAVIFGMVGLTFVKQKGRVKEYETNGVE